MHPSAEATIIADLPEITAESTDGLCLETIAGTAVLLAWHSPQVASDVFEKLAISARLITGTNASVSGDGNLAIHYFDLNEPDSQNVYADRIRQIAEEAAVAPVALTNFVNGDKVPLVNRALDSDGSSTASQPQPSPTDEPQQIYDDRSDGRDALDDLMDAFDAVDL